LLIRHGETSWSRDGRHTSRTDLPLTPIGEDQARALQQTVTGRNFCLVLSSPLERARRTAELAGLDGVEIDPDLVEWDYGEVEGRTTEDLREQWPDWTIWNGPVPGGETIDQVAARADRVIARVRSCPAGTAVAAVAHGHILRVLAARWVGGPPRAGQWLALETATVSTLGWERETPVVVHWNLRVSDRAPVSDET
jgi:broad specificity phosphatase PhoE